MLSSVWVTTRREAKKGAENGWDQLYHTPLRMWRKIFTGDLSHYRTSPVCVMPREAESLLLTVMSGSKKCWRNSMKPLLTVNPRGTVPHLQQLFKPLKMPYELLADFVTEDDTEFHVILDNYCIHNWTKLLKPNFHPTSLRWTKPSAMVYGSPLWSK